MKIRTTSTSVLLGVVLLAATGTIGQSIPAAAAAGTTYTVSSGTVTQDGHPTDTPANPFIDKDGTFYFQQSAALYGATGTRNWSFYSGTNFDTATRSPISDAVNPSNSSDSNSDTTWRCNNSPTGLTATAAPNGSNYAQRNYCDLSSTWVDPDTGYWYGLVHNEFTPQPFGDNLHFDAIDYAVSTDQGKTWTIKDHAITSPYSTTRGDTASFPNQTYYYGDGDQRLIVDNASGYFYVFYGSRVIDKSGGWAPAGFGEHVARAPISQKMAKGSWQKYLNGAWQSPGIGGAESNITSVSSSAPAGYFPTTTDYNPQNTGNIAQQSAAGQLPQNGSDLFVMNVSYDAYLGLYIGTPQTDLGDGVNRPLHFYATADLATQQWTDIGSTANYTQQSWYRWMVDSATATTGTILGKTFRSYCYFACSTASGSVSSSEDVNVTIDSSNPASPVVDPSKAYLIASGSGQDLSQSGTGLAVVTSPAATGYSGWRFTGTGDGAYTITNAVSGLALGIDSTTTTSRAWAAKPGLSAITGAGTVGQQWFIQADRITPATSGPTTASGTYHLTNRYSGLVISFSASGAQTSPYRNWSNTTTGTADTTTPQSQTISLTPAPLVNGFVGVESRRCLDISGTPIVNGIVADIADCSGSTNQQWTPTSANELRIAGAKCLDLLNHATAAGSPVGVWDCNGGTNQQWTLNADGTVRSVSSGLCLDVTSHATAAGSAVEVWTCNGGGDGAH
ncbi:MAG: ricin-type beta-trefoil lectin domain protein [Leifsonia sp.]